jgi:hypothetical protein
MKFFFYATIFWALTGMGCVTPNKDVAKGTIWKAHQESSPAPVTPDQVQPENANKMAYALWDEMDRQDQEELLKESQAKTVSPKKK